jgi:methylenetetrahydrofolate dehydrogenase (NADP+)/methenyltetrahydrofolate cyclohydrolase
MAAVIIDGTRIAIEIKNSVRHDIKGILKTQNKVLKLVALQIGKSSSSEIYLNTQIRLANELEVKYHVRILPTRISQKALEKEIYRLNKDDSVTGIIIHTPIPKHIELAELIAKVSPDKDVEGLSPINMGRLVYDDWLVAPCTANACMTLIDSTGVNLHGKEVVIVGHSDIVGKPLSLMLLSRMATTTVCHIATYEKNLLKTHVQRAEVLIVSVGKRHLIKGSWIRKGAIVIDVGINKYRGTIIGDVEFDKARLKASYITPVPGGVGPVTAAMLMRNLVRLYNAKTMCR